MPRVRHLGATSASALHALRCIEHAASSDVPHVTQSRDVPADAALTGGSLWAGQHDKSLRRRLRPAHHRWDSNYAYFSDLRHKSDAPGAIEVWHVSTTAAGVQPLVLTTDTDRGFAGQSTDEAYARLGLANRLRGPEAHVDRFESVYRRPTGDAGRRCAAFALVRGVRVGDRCARFVAHTSSSSDRGPTLSTPLAPFYSSVVAFDLFF